MFSPAKTPIPFSGDQFLAVHAVAAVAEPPRDEGVEVGVDAFFDVVDFVRRYHLVAADAETR